MAANGELMATSGIIEAWIELNGYVSRTQFVFCDSLPCPLLLETDYMAQNIWAINPMLQELEMASGATMRIRRKRIPAHYKPTPTKPLTLGSQLPTHKKVPRSEVHANNLRVAKTTVIKPHFLKVLSVTTKRWGTVAFEPKRSSIAKHSVAMTHGISFAQPNVPLPAIAANFTDKPITVPKRIEIGSVVLHQVVLSKTNITVQEVLVVGAEERMADFSDLNRRIGQAQEERASPEEMVDQINLKDVLTTYHDHVNWMLKKHNGMWRAQLA